MSKLQAGKSTSFIFQDPDGRLRQDIGILKFERPISFPNLTKLDDYPFNEMRTHYLKVTASPNRKAAIASGLVGLSGFYVGRTSGLVFLKISSKNGDLVPDLQYSVEGIPIVNAQGQPLSRYFGNYYKVKIPKSQGQVKAGTLVPWSFAS